MKCKLCLDQYIVVCKHNFLLQMSSSNEMPMSNHTGQNSMFPLHGLQHSGSQGSFGNSIYSNSAQNLADQWYYEDPEVRCMLKNIISRHFL